MWYVPPLPEVALAVDCTGCEFSLATFVGLIARSDQAVDEALHEAAPRHIPSSDLSLFFFD